MRYVDGIPVFGEPDEGALRQIRNCSRHALAVALMADNHLGYGVPIGGVMGVVGGVSPTAVGYDQGCGNKAVRLDMTGRDLRAFGVERAMDLVWANISFGLGRVNGERVDHELFDNPAWQLPAARRLRDKAAAQLGTVGTGNHYVDLFVDEDDHVWVGVHFGSRGLGHGLATHYLEAAGAKDGVDADPVVLPSSSALGSEYIITHQLALAYAYAGRDWVCAKVARLLGARVVEEVHANHNDARLETHLLEGRFVDLWVMRKGATPAWPGERGFVGGSMGDVSVILEGADPDDPELRAAQTASLFSTVHGAGRVMSRTAAKGKVKRSWVPDAEVTAELEGLCARVKNLPGGSPQRREVGNRIQALQEDRKRGRWETTVLRPGAVTQEAMDEWLSTRPWGPVVRRGGDLDEAPQAYRRLPDVLAAHEGTIRVQHTLRPVGVAMAGDDVRDPYKD